MCLMSDFHFEDLSIINNGQHIRDTLEKENYFHYITVFQSQQKYMTLRVSQSSAKLTREVT